MDSLISAAARALAGGDPLRALNHVSLRDDAPALALRGIAMAQLGDLARARALLRRAARAFTTKETVARTLAEAWPGDARRDTLIERAFRLRQVEESHRARLRVEIGRLQKHYGPRAAARHPPRLQAGAADRRRGGAGPTGGRQARADTGVSFRRRSLVQLRPGTGAGHQPAHRATGAGRSGERRQSGSHRARPSAPLGGFAGARIHDNLVTHRATARRLGWPEPTRRASP